MLTTDPMNDPISARRHDRACPYCRESIADLVDAETHILGCNERWRREHHVEPHPSEGGSPSITPWAMPTPVASRIESPTSAARRAIAESSPFSAAFRSLPAYEPAP